ncbi:MAG: cadherin repeat domain-containing protein [Pirellulaceae bacterium]|nr:cadherin repeat domain-containing protein [Pirellulaceae bacterium]
MAMSKREQFLAIAVSGVVGLLSVQFVVNSVRSGLQAKQNQLKSLEDKIETHDRKMTDSALATKRLNELKSKSLPKNREAAKNQYSAWLSELATQSGVQKVSLEDQQAAGLKSDAFSAYRFVLSGEIRLDNLIKLLHGYYNRDYLQRIRDLKITQLRDNPEMVQIKLDTEAIALASADLKQEPSLAASGRVPQSLEEYQTSILSRNPFAPPNRAPKFNVASSVDVPRDSDWSLEVKAVDPDNRHTVKYTLVSEKPEGLNFDETSGKFSWKPKANGNFDVVVQAIDTGFPPQKSEHKLTLKVVDPPAPPPPPTVEPQFDVASQSYVSAVLGGRDRNELWIRSKTDNKYFVAVAGDQIAVGSVKGKIVEVNVEEQFAELETEGRRWILSMDDPSLQAAYKRSLEN